MKKILLKNATVVSGSVSKKADVLIENEKIKKIDKNIKVDDKTEVIDLKDKLLFPGFIDGHTHFDLSVANTTTVDDFYSGSKAAISGGTTTIIDYATQYKGETLMTGLNNWKKKAKNGVSCDYGMHMSISDVNDKSLKDIRLMIKEGVTSFKLYTTYDIKLDDKDMFRTMEEIEKNKGIVSIHCENDGLIAQLRDEIKSSDKNKVKSHSLTRPDIAEAEAVNRMAYFSQKAKVAFLAVHLTCEKSVKEVELARNRGVEVYAETCPQYLYFDDSVYDKNFEEASKFVIAPPLRKKKDIDYLWKAIQNGIINIISTDHCSFTKKQKALGKNDFKKIPGGLNAVEQRGILIFDAVMKNKITKEKMCEILSENPAKLFGLYDRKGFIKEGYDADIVVIDPKKNTTFSLKNQVSKSDYCIFENKTFRGHIDKVFLRGEVVVENNIVNKKEIKNIKENKGKFIKRKLYKKISL